jgi:hypothetical protein
MISPPKSLVRFGARIYEKMQGGRNFFAIENPSFASVYRVGVEGAIGEIIGFLRGIPGRLGEKDGPDARLGSHVEMVAAIVELFDPQVG